MPLIIVAMLQGCHATSPRARVAPTSGTLELGRPTGWFVPWSGRRTHVKRIDLALVHLLSLLYMVLSVRHRCVFLLLKLLQGHLGHKSRRSVRTSVCRHRIRLFHSLHLLNTIGAAPRIGKIRVSTGLRLGTSVLGVLPIFHTGPGRAADYRVLMRRRLFARRSASTAHLRDDLRRAIRRWIRTVRRILMLFGSSLIR